MKILLLAPSAYTLHHTLSHGFSDLSFNLYHYDYRKFLGNLKQRLNVQMFRLPYRLRNIWENNYLTLINKNHFKIFHEQKPEIVFIYNSEMLLPTTLEYFKSQNTKIIFIIGDSPYYTPTNRYYLSLLFMADLIISPDSFWADQLNLLGLKNIIVDFPGFDETVLHFREPTIAERNKFTVDILFVGTGYYDSWGYKRTLFLSKFAPFNLKIYGNNKWPRWIEFFPELKPKFELLKSRISLEQLVIMHKCAKIYPVDANPAILNGAHLRAFDCLAMGVLPVVEYRKDYDLFFKGVHLPLIKNYNHAVCITKQYLNDDNLRERTLGELKEYIIKNYRADIVLKRILDRL